MSSKRKFNRKSKYTLSQKIISAVTAAGFIMQPFTAFAHTITPTEGFGTIVDTKGNVANIWAGKVVGNTAINKFDTFGLSANEIANMYFGKDINNHNADNLVNFVNSRIDINGTVNAVKNNKIGGNLFFLSKDGMAVGKSGVINTGSLYVMTPASDDLNTEWNKLQNQVESNGTFGNDNIVEGWEAIPVNNSGTITVLGKINATNDVQLRAAKIGVGKNVDDKVVDGVAAGAIVEDSTAHIKTGVANFADIVNIEDTNGNIITKAGLGENLTAEVSGNGDIVLAAVSSVTDEREGKANAVVDVYGNLTGNNVKLSAESEVTFKEDTNTLVTGGNVGEIQTALMEKVGLGTISANYADIESSAAVTVGQGASINADGDVSVTAQSKASADVGAAPKQNEDGTFGGFMPAVGVVVADVNNDASVNINGNITAGGGIDINAAAETSLTAAAADSGEEAGGSDGKKDPASLIHAAVVVAEHNTNATVNVNDAKIKGKGNVNVTANVDDSLDISAQVGAPGKSAMATAVAVVEGNGAATVNLSGGSIEGNNVTVAAENHLEGNVIKVDNGIGLPQDPADDSSGGSEETTPQEELKDAAMQILGGEAVTDVIANGITDKVVEAIGGTTANKKQNPFLQKIGNMLDVGASVAVVEESNKANVKINNTNVQAAGEGKVDIHANTIVDNTTMIVTGHANKQTHSKKNRGQGSNKNPANIIADAAVLYNEIDNDAAVEINGAAISGKTVNINTSAQMQSNLRKMYNDLTASVDDLKTALKDTWDSSNEFYQKLDQLLTDTGKAFEKAESGNYDDAMIEQLFNEAFTKIQAAAETLSGGIDEVKDSAAETVGNVQAAKDAFDSVKSNLEAFKDTDNYVNYYVHTESTDGIEGKGSKPAQFELGVAGSVNITNVNNNAAIGIGAGTAINAGESAEIKSDTLTETLSITGNAVALMGSKKKNNNQQGGTPSGGTPSGGTPSGGNTNNTSSTNIGVGASVAVQDISGNSVVVIGEGVNIGGKDNASANEVTIAADNTMSQQGIVYGSGESAGNNQSATNVQLQGMVNLLNGGSNSVVSIDDNVNIAGNTVNLKADNSSLITAVTGGATFSKSGGNAASVGASLGMVNYDVNNVVVVGDNGDDADLTLSSKDDDEKTAEDKAADKRKEGTKLAKDLLDGARVTLAEDVNTSAAKGTITAHELNAQADTDGLILNLAVEAAANTKSKKKKPNSALNNLNQTNNNNNDNNLANQIVGNNGSINQQLNQGDTNAQNAANNGGNISGGLISGNNGGNTNRQLNQNNNQSTSDSVKVAGAGSVSINMLDGETAAIIDGVTVNSVKDAEGKAGTVAVNAEDSLFDGSFAGAAAINWFTKTGSATGGSSSGSSTEVSVGGAAGVSVLDRGVSAVISNSDINNAASITNTATKSGAEIATGLGLAVAASSGSSGGTNVAVGAAVSYNEADSDIYALMVNNAVDSTEEGITTDLTNKAYNKDLQISGGVSVALTDGGKTGVGVGGTAVISQIDNDLQSGIFGGTYNDMGKVDIDAVVATTQVSAAVAGAASVGSSTPVGFGGAVNYSNIDNTNNAFINGATINAGGEVSVVAGDTNGDADSDTNEFKSDYAAWVEEHGIDASGKTGTEWADSGYTDDENNVNFSAQDNTGSTIVNVATAAGVALSEGSSGGSGAAGVNVSQINNDMNANITGAKITAGSVHGQADTNTKIIAVAAGLGVSNGKFGGAGSVSWDELSNNNKVTIAGSTINTGSLTANAMNKADIINVAGQLSGSSGAGVGVAMAYNAMDNTTGVYVNGGTVNLTDDGTGILALNAKNEADIMAITAGATAAQNAAINGIVAVNRGSNSTEAVIGNTDDKVTITGVKDIDVTVNDSNENLTIAGGITAAGKVAVGAGVAYSDIGGSSGDGDKAQQKTRAEINNADITTAADAASIDVTVNDISKLTTIAAGLGGAGTAAVQGEAATALVNKQVNAGMSGTSINADNADNKSANVNVKANSDTDITTSAAVVAGGGTAGVGAGVAVNRIVQQTNAAVNGGTMNVNNLTVNAYANPAIQNIGVGIAAAGQGAGVAGSVSVNMIDNDVTAHIGNGANIVADGNVGVLAASDEQISNYSGMLAAAGQGAGVGISVSVNQIKGETNATVGDAGTDTSITANGDDNNKLKTETNIAETEINNALISSDTVDIDTKIDRTEENRSGLIVDASSTRDMKSFLINVAGAGQGAGVAPTVNINMIEGATNAGITDTTVNNGSSNAGNVFVNAGDYTNMSGFVGSGGIAGMGAGVGLGSDTNTVSREVTAIVSGSDINAGEFEIDAESMQGVSSFVVGAAVGGIGAGVAGVVTVTELDNETKAALQNSKVEAGKVTVNANHKGIVNAGNVGIGGAGIGAGVGLSVGVLKDDSKTYAEVTSDSEDKNSITATGDVKIAATNTAVVKPSVSATGVAGVGAGVAGATSVNNLNSKVVTNISGVDITSGGSISGTADNTFNVDAYMGSQAGGVGGVGVGVTVNTIDSTVQTNVTDSTLDAAEDITLTAQETRTIKQTATNVAAGGVAVGANIAITNVGQAVENIVDENGETVSNAYDKITEANDVYKNKETGEDNSGDLLAGAEGALETAGIDSDKAIPHVGAGYGGENKESQITVNITNSNIEAANNVTAKATENDKINMTLGSGAAGAAAVNAGVGILNVHRNVGVNIIGSNITAAKAVELASVINGSSNLDVYQGTAGILGVNAAYGGATSDGTSGVTISSGTIDGGSINILAEDAGRTDVEAIGITAGVVSAGAIVAEGTNESQTAVNVFNTKMNSDADIDIKAERQAKDENGNKLDTLSVSAKAGSGGLIFAGVGVGATANELGKVGVTVNNGSNLTAGNAINITALNAPSVSAATGAVSGSMLASGAITVAEANIGTHIEPEDKENENKEDNGHLKTFVNITEGNSFTAKSLTAEARADAAQNVKMEGLSLSASLLPNGALQANTGGAEVYSDVEVNVGENVFKGSDTEAAANGIDLDISGVNSVDQEVNATGISVSTVFASGTNIADSSAQLSTQVQVDGPSEDSEINNVDLNASSYAKVDTDANGYGGAIAEASPYAAKVNNNYTADTDVIVNGDWNTVGNFDAQAVNGMDIDLKSDAVRAAVVGLSGTWLDNTINNAANVTVNNANITTGGAQSYIAQNTVDYNGEIDGSGYGGVNVNATDYYDDLDFTAGVDITNSTLNGAGDSGSITAFANTRGNITTKNSLKSAGVIPVALAFSDHAIDYNNSVNVVNSDLTTDKADADITLAATDDTDVKLETIADTQGGVAGAASAEASNNFNRANKINIDADSNLLSTKDINLYAGADANGTKSSLNLQVLADAYNKTAIPVYTDPKVDNSMTQSNQIELAGNAESVRHINASAQKGTTTVTESAQEYKVWTGTGGEGQVASTALGDTIKNEKADNYVNITGNAAAGIHNELDITISGQTATTDPVRDENDNILTGGSVSYDKNNITINAGGDWFTKDDIKIENITVINGLMDRYNQVMEYLQAYDKNSDAYKAYEAEKNLLLLEMQKAGFAEKAGENGELVPLPSIELPAVELPDIVVSGGNINIEADEFKGDGSITANGAPKLTITNKSDMYLKVNDLTISDNGGLINVEVENKNSFSGTQQADGISGDLPTITIDGASADKDSFGNNKRVQADIGIFGDITNTAGNVKITSDNYNILVNGNVSGRNITIAATKGNITQQSSEGVLNVGNDPIARLQLSEEIAEKIQKYLYDKMSSGSKSFKDYQEYLSWLINDVGITFSDLGLKEDIDKYLDWSATDEEIFNAVDNDSYTDSQVQQMIADAKAGGIESWKKFLNDHGISCSYDLASIESALAKEDTGTIAGGNIYMDAVNINIGGLIQSGYASYSTTLTDTDKQKVDALDKDWQSNRKVLTDNDVMGNDKYLVNEGGEHFNNDTGLWEYEVKVYYNPSTGQLLTESVRPEGGNIQISGKVSSTGGGRIMAMDGTSDVSIDTTAVGKDVKVNSITVNDITGLISIADKNTGKTTQYRNGQQRTFKTGTDAESVAWSTGSNSYTYNPEQGSQFAWTGGVSGERIEEYSYTEDFLFWGALPYNKSEDLLEHIETVDGEITEGPVNTYVGDPLKDGSLITGGYTGGDDMLTINWTYRDTSEPIATDPHVDKVYDGTAGKIFGYGEFIYTWTETTGDQMASTSGLKADHEIQIGFLGNGNGEGNIKVDSAQDMLLNGNISNATIVDANNDFAGKGSVNLISNNGSVSAIGSANINSDDVNIEAATGVNVNHTAIGDSANINIATDSGDIKFVSTGGDLKIEQAVTGGTNAIDAATGSVYLEAQGSLIDAATGDYAVKGQRIDLISHTGTIGTKDKALTVLGGSELYSSDTMASSVNAQAQGDIVLTQVDNDNVAANGSSNMRLGTIVSENGDAVLTVNDGSFVDAHPSENNDSSSAQDKIDRWLEAGLIVEKDAEGNEVSADDSTASAEQAKAERVKALTDRMETLAAEGEHSVQDYKDAADDFYKDEGISAAKAAYLDAVAKANSKTEGDQTNEGGEINVADAYAKYQAAQKAYFDNKGFSEAEQETIINYAEVANSDNYGWSKNQLLYAIQDSVLNTDPGEVQTVETPNVTANNITLNAATGGVGIDGEAKVIDYANLNDEANLKLLAQAKAGDLTWHEDTKQVEIRQQQAITVSVKKQDDNSYGKVIVIGKDNVYLAGVKDTELNINGVTTDGDIRLQGDNGVNVDGTLTGEDLTIAGGTGNIMGTGSDKYVNTNIGGTLDANADGSIFISQTGDLKVLTVATDALADIKATNNILMSDVEGSTAQGYINAQTLNLTAGGNIGIDGEKVNAIRVLDNGIVINASASGDIILAGAHGEDSTGSIVLGDIKGANLDVTSISNINLGRENDAATEEDETVNSNINSGTVELTTSNGSITETEGSAVDAETVKATATQNVVLAGNGNAIDNFVVNGYGADNTLNGNVDLVSTANNENNVVNVEFGKGEVGLTVNNGYVNVSSLGDSSNLNISGGSVTTNGENAGDVTFTSEGSITADTTVNSAANIVMDAGGAITNIGALTAQDNVNVNTTAGAINIGGSVTATDNDVNITTGSGAIRTTGAISGGTNVKVDAGTTGTIDLGGDVTAEGGDVVVTTDDGYIKTTGAVTANNDVKVDTLNGLINLGGLVDAETGFVNVTTGSGSITTGGYVSGHKDVTLDSDGGDITVGGYTESETQNVTATVKGDGNINFAGTVSASGDVKAEVTGKGDITTDVGAEVSGTDIIFTTNVGDITTGSNLTANENVDLNVNTGDITFGAM